MKDVVSQSVCPLTINRRSDGATTHRRRRSFYPGPPGKTWCSRSFGCMGGTTGLEPATSAVTAKRKVVTYRKQASRMASIGAVRNDREPLSNPYQTHDLCPVNLCPNLRFKKAGSRVCLRHCGPRSICPGHYFKPPWSMPRRWLVARRGHKYWLQPTSFLPR